MARSRRENDAGIGFRTLGVRTRLLREEGSFTQGHDFFVQLEKTLKLKRVEFIENGKSVLFLGDYITKFKDKIALKSKDAYVDNMFAMLGMESCKPTNTTMVHHALTTFIWVTLNENAKRAKILWTIAEICSNPRSLQEQEKSYLVQGT